MRLPVSNHRSDVIVAMRALLLTAPSLASAGSTFFLDSNGDPRFKRKAAVIGSLDIPLPRWDGTGYVFYAATHALAQGMEWCSVFHGSCMVWLSCHCHLVLSDGCACRSCRSAVPQQAVLHGLLMP
jgi:hypothetical protein